MAHGLRKKPLDIGGKVIRIVIRITLPPIGLSNGFFRSPFTWGWGWGYD